MLTALSPLLRKVLLGVLLSALFPLTHWLQNKGIITADEVPLLGSELFSWILTVAGVIWAATHGQKRENTALASNATTPANLDAMLRAGTTAPAMTPKNEVPVLTSTGDGKSGPTIIPIVLLALLLPAIAGCPDKTIKLPTSVPTSVSVVEPALMIAVSKGLVIANDLVSLAEKAGAGYLDVSAGLVPFDIDRKIRAGFRGIATQSLDFYDDVEKGLLKSWPELKARIDPILRSVASVIDMTKSLSAAVKGAGGWWSVVKDLAGTAIQLLGILPADVRDPDLQLELVALGGAL